MSAERGEPVKKLVVVRSVWSEREEVKRGKSGLEGFWTYSRDTVTSLPPPPARSPRATAHTNATCD